MITKLEITRNYINGDWQEAKTGETMISVNPATGEIVGESQKSGLEDIKLAIKLAKAAFHTSDWRSNSSRRSDALMQWAYKLKENREEIARILTTENGKPIKESRIELDACIDTLKYFAGMARSIFGRSINLSSTSYGIIDKEPIGVVGIISPWNWPAMLMIREVAPALAAGNAVVLKPASRTPLISTAIVKLIEENSDFPPGIVNIVSGPGKVIGDEMTTNPDVNAISFTGDTTTGKNLMKKAAEKVKKLALELGGKSPNIIFPDANLNKAIPAVAKSAFITAGQMCFAGSRVIVHESIHKEVVEGLRKHAEKLKVGNGLNETTDMGPVISEEQLNKILEYCEIGRQDAKLITGGNRLTGGDYDKGYYIEPTIFDQVPIESRIAQEEIFGPVLAIQVFRDEEEAISLANGTIFGLAAGVWTKDVNRAMRIAKKVEAGTVWINTYNKNYPQAEFGGYKESGIGRTRGIEGLMEYTETKHINIEIEE
ncbi:aldehyde dehydrogenase family protein [Peribacillus frigoritolerans]|uniref:Aldehyde dehydrogenase family protein n=1 Tax=Peribacillus frigoritolerans TaxID=450367 RepID=A0AAJ1QP22_9BACI|nr:aldehyde dehydrogenase family protein [Peribacillus frigoritolerans]MDM5284852.1 aldehyde dehydrogenase family protein [Peribacillus frigoritolerans]